MIEIKPFDAVPDKEKLTLKLAAMDNIILKSAGTTYDNSSWSAANFNYNLPSKDNVSFIIQENNELIGFSIGYAFLTKWFHISRFAIHPDVQGKGLSRKLLTTQLQVMEKYTPDIITVDTKKDNQAARKLYESFKFAILEEKELNAYVQIRDRKAEEYLSIEATHIALIKRYKESFHLKIA